jgi:hypothetical protein
MAEIAQSENLAYETSFFLLECLLSRNNPIKVLCHFQCLLDINHVYMVNDQEGSIHA